MRLLIVSVAASLFAAEPDWPALEKHIGGVFRSLRVPERFRSVYGPAAGALIEAYRIARTDISLSGVPQVEKQ